MLNGVANKASSGIAVDLQGVAKERMGLQCRAPAQVKQGMFQILFITLYALASHTVQLQRSSPHHPGASRSAVAGDLTYHSKTV